jgi:hypothetical protein
LSLTRRAIKEKFPTPTVPLTAVLQNRQVFLPDRIVRTVQGSIVKEIFESKRVGSRGRGRPRMRWLVDVEEGLREMKVRDGDRRQSTRKKGSSKLWRRCCLLAA